MSTEHAKTKASSHAGSMGNLSVDELSALTDRSKYCYDLVNSWIGNNDNKVSVSCAVLTGVFGVISFLSERIAHSESVPIHSYWVQIHTVCFLLSLFVMGISIILFSIAIIPNLCANGESKKYPIFFGDIALLSYDEYEKKVTKATITDFIDELSHETHLNSKICFRKMRLFRAGMISSLLAIGLAILSFVAHILMY